VAHGWVAEQLADPIVAVPARHEVGILGFERPQVDMLAAEAALWTV